jgi:hypothetical protein
MAIKNQPVIKYNRKKKTRAKSAKTFGRGHKTT